MGRLLIVDTNLLVAVERGREEALSMLRDDDELAIAAVSLAELLVGVDLAPDERVAATRRATIAAIVDSVEVLDYTEATAERHAALLGHTRRSGTPRGAHDLIIAAHAVQSGRAICTRDTRARFGDLPGVHLV